MLNITNITPPRVPLTDERTGLISREWYRFFLNLFTLTGSGQSSTTLTDLQQEVFNLQLGPAPSQTTKPAPGQLSAITITASPFTYVNSSVYAVDVMISGGGISNLEICRNGGTFFNTGSYYGMFALSPSDTLRVTYVSPPTMTLIPR